MVRRGSTVRVRQRALLDPRGTALGKRRDGQSRGRVGSRNGAAVPRARCSGGVSVFGHRDDAELLEEAKLILVRPLLGELAVLFRATSSSIAAVAVVDLRVKPAHEGFVGVSRHGCLFLGIASIRRAEPGSASCLSATLSQSSRRWCNRRSRAPYLCRVNPCTPSCRRRLSNGMLQRACRS